MKYFVVFVAENDDNEVHNTFIETKEIVNNDSLKLAQFIICEEWFGDSRETTITNFKAI